MFHYIKGQLTMKFDGGVVVEAGGIGYEIRVPENSSIYMTKEGEVVMVYTTMMVREDDVSIYGFGTRDSLGMFKKLITVNGVGAKVGISILSAMSVDEVKRAIMFEDAAYLSRANGVGKKTAERIILELKDKIGKMPIIPQGSNLGGEDVVVGDQRTEALNALVALGYSKGEAIYALSQVEDNTLTTEGYIKKALNQMMK